MRRFFDGLLRAGSIDTGYDGKPVAQGKVTVSAGLLPRSIVFTDDDGRFLVPGMPSGHCSIRASHADFGEGGSSLVMEPGRTVTVKLKP